MVSRLHFAQVDRLEVGDAASVYPAYLGGSFFFFFFFFFGFVCLFVCLFCFCCFFFVFVFGCFFFCVPQLYLWGSPLLGEIFAYVTVF